MATTMLNAKLHHGNHSLEMLVIPEFKPMNLLFEGDWGYERPDSQIITLPFIGDLSIPMNYKDDVQTDYSLRKSELGLRFSTFLFGTDLSLMYLKIREDRPVYFTQLTTNEYGVPVRVDLTPTHPWQHFFGLNFSKPAGAFVFRGEGGYYPERHFNTENTAYLTKGMIVGKPFSQIMLGADYQLSSSLDLSIQGINERIIDYETGIQEDENVSLSTVMIRGHFFNETVSPLFFRLYNFKDLSSLTRLSVDWNYADNFTITVGADFLSGESNSMFGMYDDNDNIYLKVKYSF
jgi:hypothetical protein